MIHVVAVSGSHLAELAFAPLLIQSSEEVLQDGFVVAAVAGCGIKTVEVVGTETLEIIACNCLCIEEIVRDQAALLDEPNKEHTC